MELLRGVLMLRLGVSRACKLKFSMCCRVACKWLANPKSSINVCDDLIGGLLLISGTKGRLISRSLQQKQTNRSPRHFEKKVE